MFYYLLFSLLSVHSESFSIETVNGTGVVRVSSNDETSPTAGLYQLFIHSNVPHELAGLSLSKERSSSSHLYSAKLTGQNFVILKRTASFVKLGFRGDLSEIIASRMNETGKKVRNLKCYPGKAGFYQCILDLTITQ